MSRIEALQDEITRQIGALDGPRDLTGPELRAILRAVRLAFRDPSADMLRAGWGGHLNVDSELGEQFARDDYARLMEAALEEPAAAPPRPAGKSRSARSRACLAQD